MTCFICPVCKSRLIKGEKTYRCENGHSYDIAKQGYVNLLMSQSHGRRHGDDKLMVKARRDFLDGGYYDKLSMAICDLAVNYSGESVSVIDAGCGECKYTVDVLNRLKETDKKADIWGVDISKDALIYGCKMSTEIGLAVAGASRLPFEDDSADIILSIFAPFESVEFRRVLKSDGAIIRAFPLERHLWELKRLIYDNPYENKVSDMDEPGLRIVDRRQVKYDIELDDNQNIENLFKMTPYYYKTGIKDQQKLNNVESLKVRLEFGLVVYKKI